MRERKGERDFTYVQLRMQNDLHGRLVDVSAEDNRTIHGELLEVSAMWVKLPRQRRLALLHEAESIAP